MMKSPHASSTCSIQKHYREEDDPVEMTQNRVLVPHRNKHVYFIPKKRQVMARLITIIDSNY